MEFIMTALAVMLGMILSTVMEWLIILNPRVMTWMIRHTNKIAMMILDDNDDEDEEEEEV